MAKLVHEIWEVTDNRGGVLPALILAGPDGEAARKLLGEEGVPKCVGRFEAGSHFEAMTIYYRHYGRGDYRTDFVSDREPYPEERARRQKS
jgi:hypothetical protein